MDRQQAIDVLICQKSMLQVSGSFKNYIQALDMAIAALEQQQHPCGGECKCKAATVVWCKDCRWYHDEVCCNDDSDYCADYPDEYGSCKCCQPKED